ncbi:hypothetical protein [Streptomyces sp. NRRL S-118]|uniref:hypothetical protein n=1 Tax=Streptomyces sp. NRRL S-118 TaxID=1463881 RepID=UPI0006943B82|nr:hypothetical protein [Streptomyces sp. NRRL S-118]
MRRDTDGPRGPAAALLAAAVRGDGAVDPRGEERVLAAFRAARDEGAHAGRRTRRRDDWRPGREQRRRRSARATALGLAATVLLGGVAVAGQTGAIDSPFGGGDGGGAVPGTAPASTPAHTTPGTPHAEGERRPSGPAPTARPGKPGPGDTRRERAGDGDGSGDDGGQGTPPRPARKAGDGGADGGTGTGDSGTGTGAATGRTGEDAGGAGRDGGGGKGGDSGRDDTGGQPAGGEGRP